MDGTTTLRAILVTVVFGVGLIVALGVYDLDREGRGALDEFGETQVAVAHALAAGLVDEGERWPNAQAMTRERLAASLADFHRDGTRVVLVGAPHAKLLRSTDGHDVEPGPLASALSERRRIVRLGPQEARGFGLVERTAFAGIAYAESSAGTWSIVNVASAEGPRDREKRARTRLVVGVLVAGGFVTLFGALALRLQRRELVLANDLSLAALARDRNDELERAGRAATLGTIAMGIAHEVTTPLNVIAGRADQIAKRAGNDERIGDPARAILEQTARIAEVVRSLLDLARGRDSETKDVLPADVARTAMRLVAHRFEAAKVNVVDEIEETLPPVSAHARLMEQALVNLLLNACESCEPGGIVELRVSRTDDGVAFEVRDDGAGIDPAHVDLVLRPFFSTKGEHGSSGLGLPIAREIVAAHRGTLTLEPNAPRGTIARILLPAAARDA